MLTEYKRLLRQDAPFRRKEKRGKTVVNVHQRAEM